MKKLLERLRLEAPALLVLGLALLVLLGATGPAWRYTPLGGMDDWSYVGYAKHYLDPEFRAGLYKSCRLPWIWWEVVIRNLFPGEPGSRALFYSLLAAWALAWYSFARRYGNPGLAALAGTIALFYLPAHGPGGWDYHNTLAGIFLVLAMSVAARIGQGGVDRWRDWVGLGVLVALAFHTNITLVNTFPMLLFPLWPALRGREPVILLRRLATVFLGGVGLTVLLAVGNVAVGRRPFFYWKMVETAFRFVGDSSQQEPWYRPFEPGWVYGAHYLSLPLAALLFAMPLGVRSFGGGWGSPAGRLGAMHLFLCGVWLLWHFAGQTALNIASFAYPLGISSLAVVVSALLLSPRFWPSPVSLLFSLGAAGLLAAGGLAFPWLPPPVPLLAQAGLFLAALVGMAWGSFRWAPFMGLVLLALATAATPEAQRYGRIDPKPNLSLAHDRLLSLQDWAWPLRHERSRPPRPSLAVVLSGRSFQTDPLAHLVWNPGDPTPWFAAFVRSLGSTDFEMSFPDDRARALLRGEGTREDFARLEPGMCLFVAETREGFSRSVKDNLRRLGIPFRVGPDREEKLEWGVVRLERILFL